MKTKIFTIIIALILAIQLVSAVGISKGYYQGEPLKIGPGESKTVSVALIMANAETSERKISLQLISGSEIAQLTQTEILVPAGSTNKEIKLDLNIPNNVAEGTEYTVEFSVSDATSSNEKGMVGFTTGQMVSIPVLVQKSATTEQPSTTVSIAMIWILVIVIIIAAAILVWFFMFKKKNTAEKNSRK